MFRGPDGRFIKGKRETVIDVPLFEQEFIERPLPKFYRVSVGMNFVVHDSYYGALIQVWTADRDDAYNMIPDLEDDLIRMVEKFVKAPSSEWWFTTRIGNGVQRDIIRRTRYEVIEEGLDAERKAQS